MESGFHLGIILLLVAISAPLIQGHKGPPSNEGSDFYFSFGTNRSLTKLQLFISTPESHDVDFTIETFLGVVSKRVSAQQQLKVDLQADVLVTSSTERNKGIRLKSNDGTSNLVVIGVYSHPVSFETFTAFPVIQYSSYVYFAISIFAVAGRFKSSILLTGAKNITNVTITPTQDVDIPSDLRVNGCPPLLRKGLSCSFFLNEKETFYFTNFLDLTGTKIVSDQPLSVFSGHECAHVPLQQGNCEPLVEQIPPVITWGRTFLVDSLAGRLSGEYYKVVTAEKNTTFQVYCTQYGTSMWSKKNSVELEMEGTGYEFFIPENNTCSFKADKPILLVVLPPSEHFMNSIKKDGAFISIVPPIEQYSNNYTFSTFSDVGHVSIMVPSQYCINSSCGVIVNGTTISSSFLPVYCTNYSVCGYITTYRLPCGRHMIDYHQSFERAKFGLFYYTFAASWGYGIVPGMRLSQLSVEKPEVSISTYNTSGSGTYLVVGTELKLTCTAVIKELSQDIAIDILMTWAIPGRIIDEYRPVISQENDCHVSFEHHIPSLSFNHSNNYTCLVSLSSPYSDVKASSKSILVTVREVIHYTYFQFHLTGVINCKEWVLSNTYIKTEELRLLVKEEIESSCKCGYSRHLLSLPILICPTTNPSCADDVTFRVRIEAGGESPLNFEQISAIFEQMKGRLLPVQGLLIKISTECDVKIKSFQDPLCLSNMTKETCCAPTQYEVKKVDDSQSVNTNVKIGATLGSALVLLVATIAVVGVIMLYRYRKPRPMNIHLLNSSTDSFSIGIGSQTSLNTNSGLLSPVMKPTRNGIPSPITEIKENEIVTDL